MTRAPTDEPTLVNTPLSSLPNRGAVLVSAGRRVDAADASVPRFPQKNVSRVQSQIENFLDQQKPAAIVSSAACGADLLVLESGLGDDVPCHILLPSSPDEFRRSSVADRPGDWGTIYDAVLKDSEVEVLTLPSGDEGYLEVNRKLLDKAQVLAAAGNAPVSALVIWNMESRGVDDVTAHFLNEARRRNIPVTEISTL